MTKEEYLESDKQLIKEIADLQNKRRKLEKDYVLANSEYKMGEKVRVIDTKGRERFSYVCSATVHYLDGSIRYELKRVKKDGGMSEIRDYVNVMKIEKINSEVLS